jgi:predicted enzyme related to lactoylglutathione lyase
MIRTTIASLTAGALVALAPAVHSAPAPIVYFDIAAPDLKSQAAFYHAVFDWDFAPDGRVTVPVNSPAPGALEGTLRQENGTGEPPTERVIYVGVPDIPATLAKVIANGGSVVFGRTVVPGVVILALFKDPAGNRMGIVEMAGGKAKVPPKP